MGAISPEVRREYLLRAVDETFMAEGLAAHELGGGALRLFEDDGNQLSTLSTVSLILRELLAFPVVLPGSSRELHRMTKEGILEPKGFFPTTYVRTSPQSDVSK